MSTSEEILLQPVDDKKVVIGSHTKHPQLLEQVITQGAFSSTKGTAAQCKWKKIFTTVATLIAYAILNAGISVIAPFYSIVVSFILDHLACCLVPRNLI